jgi:signal transduction histidine kinase/CheY-like chemotaxis protein
MEQLNIINATLENRVAERTLELAQANEALKAEIETRQAAEAQARQAQKMETIGQLAGGIAHDYNNMLAIIMGSLDLAKRRLPSNQNEIGKYIDGALDGARRSADLTHRLLAFSRQQPLAPASTDLNSLVQGMASLLARTLGVSTELECVLDPDLWQAHIDRTQMESAILNLAVNARDAMPGGGRLVIETHNAVLDAGYAALQPDVVAGDYVLVAVSDTGTGMTPEVIARAFDPFFTTKETGRGTGLGLSQVYGFVKQSGGHLKVYSGPAQGTTVKVYLPRDFSAAESTSAGQQTPQSAEPLPRGAPGEILLVVEDEDNVRNMTVSSLRELSYTVRHARSGQEALDILSEQNGIKLLLVDVIMPKMTGRELVEIVKQRFAGLKILYTTGYSPQAILQNAPPKTSRAEHGASSQSVELLMKPFTLSQLAHKVRCMLDTDLTQKNVP